MVEWWIGREWVLMWSIGNVIVCFAIVWVKVSLFMFTRFLKVSGNLLRMSGWRRGRRWYSLERISFSGLSWVWFCVCLWGVMWSWVMFGGWWWQVMVRRRWTLFVFETTGSGCGCSRRMSSASMGGRLYTGWCRAATMGSSSLHKKYNKVLMRFNEQKYLNCHSNVILYSLSQSARRFVNNSKEFFG